MDDNDIAMNLEKMSLLADRYYIILTPTGEGEFRLTAYDTTELEYESDEDFNAAFVVQEGLLAMLKENTEEVFEAGVLSIQHQALEEEVVDNPSANVVKVDFGTKQ